MRSIAQPDTGADNMNITADIRYIGVNDRKIDLFEGQYAVPNGMSYNSYALLDEKVEHPMNFDVK